MSNNVGKRTFSFALSLVFFVILLKCGSESFLSPAFFDWWWFGAFASLVGYDQTIRWDERLKHGI